MHLSASVEWQFGETGEDLPSRIRAAHKAGLRHAARFGSRNEGILSAGVSLSTKLGMALGTAGIAFLLGLFDYAPGQVSEAAKGAFRGSYYGEAVVLLLIQAAVVWFWPIDSRTPARDFPA